MSKTATRLPLARAQQLAAVVKAELEDACERIEVAGSVRRRYWQIGDLEFVAIPKRHFNLLGAAEDERTVLDDKLAALVRAKKMVRLQNGPKYKQFELVKSGVKLDLFLCRPETWAVCLMIRTGPADFSQQFVVKKSNTEYTRATGRRGFLEDYMSIGNGTPEGCTFTARPWTRRTNRSCFGQLGCSGLNLGRDDDESV